MVGHREAQVAAILTAALVLPACGGAPITLTTYHDPLPGQPECVVEIDPRLYGRGCVDVIASCDEVWATIQQDGTTDWIIGRAAPRVVADSVVAVMAAITAPVDLIAAALGAEKPPIPPPSEVHGCGSLLGIAAVEEEERPGLLRRILGLGKK